MIIDPTINASGLDASVSEGLNDRRERIPN